MATVTSQFEQRFQNVVDKMRSTKVLIVLGWTALALASTLAAMACIDYFFETNWAFRAIIFAVAFLAAGCAGASLALRALHRWNRNTTAASVENRFEDLGQSVRTSVQFNEQDPINAGVSPRLLEALNKDVEARTEELRLTEAVSSGPLKVSLGLLALVGVLTIGAFVSSWDWRMAISRAFLSNTPYTTVKVEQGDSLVDEKATFVLNADLTGRVDRNVKLLTRELSDESGKWEIQPLGKKDEIKKDVRFVSYEVNIPKIKKPFEYQVVADNYKSPVHTVDVRYPLAIETYHIEVSPPEYTGLGTKVFEKGSFETVQGSYARLSFTLDNPPDRAWIEMKPINTPLGEDPEIETIVLNVDGKNLWTELEDLQDDRIYQVFAEANDGTKMRPNRFRIRVHEDRPPKLAFRRPEQFLEVHPLAEILLSLRVSDDYGLRKAGIRLQMNNDPEIPLLDIEYDDIATEDGTLTPQTKAKLEEFVPLEYFNMMLKDSVSYYAYAEDNHPGSPNINETDLHFIDVRVFRENFQMPTDGNGLLSRSEDGQNTRDLPQLTELIDRERHVLNRTMQIRRRDERGKSVDPNAIDTLIEFQNRTSQDAGALGDEAVIEETNQGIDEDGRISDLMYAAQDAMLASVDSLSNSEWEVGQMQVKEALQHLLDARTRLTRSSNNGGGGFSNFANASRRMRNRMRRPRTNRERAREIVRRLRRAASEQDFLMEKFSDLSVPESPETDQPEDEAQEENPQDEQEMQNEENDGPTMDELRRELEEEQGELSDDITDIVDMIEELDELSQLAQQRTQRASSVSDSVIGALERGDTRSAMSSAASAARTFRMLAENIAGVTEEEATRRLEIARDLGMMLTEEVRGLEYQLSDAEREMEEADLPPQELAQQEQELAEPLASAAADQAELAKTVDDILDSIVQGLGDPEDNMVKRITEIMEENKLSQLIARMQAVPETIDAMNWADARVQAGDLGDRFDIVSQRLDAMHRELLAPRVEQLRKLEKRAVETRKNLEALETVAEVDRWHVRADGLLDDISAADIAETQIAAVRESMVAAGWGENETWEWEPNAQGTGLAPPADYDESLLGLIVEIRRYIRELSMIDSDVVNSGAVPPQYQEFVSRYFEVMSGAVESPQSEEE